MTVTDYRQASTPNPFLTLHYEPALEALGDDYYDIVTAAEFPQRILRFRNDDVLMKLGLNPQSVTDEDFIIAFGRFEGRRPLLALRYHGYQFGEYNPFLGDGRGFLYGQVRGIDGELYDLGTKGSGKTPYSRGADGRLTLKGGVREVLAAEALHHLGVWTSRCLSLIETGESLWRGDEPSPTRSSVMVRVNRSHIRFGTFERLHYIDRPDLTASLLDHVIEQYYAHIWNERHESKDNAYAQFYAELVQRVANLAAQWMSVGFCHAVLNTDNMSITGESFDYGPYAFIERYDPRFTAAYFDYYGRYSYGNQPLICHWNLKMLQDPLKALIPPQEMDAALAQFDPHYQVAYYQRMLNKLGFDDLPPSFGQPLIALTLQLLEETQYGYHDFFLDLRHQFSPDWREDPQHIFSDSHLNIARVVKNSGPRLDQWRHTYHRVLNQIAADELERIPNRLCRHNPNLVLLRSEIEAIWEPIVADNDWQPFYRLLKQIRESVCLDV
jgi:uncharacterized protein YdiU (UPF0061 family)